MALFWLPAMLVRSLNRIPFPKNLQGTAGDRLREWEAFFSSKTPGTGKKTPGTFEVPGVWVFEGAWRFCYTHPLSPSAGGGTHKASSVRMGKKPGAKACMIHHSGL